MKKITEEFDKLNININKDGSELNDFLICWNYFSKRPNKLSIHNTYSTESFCDLLDEFGDEKTINTEILPTEEGKLIFNQEVFHKVNDNIFISYFIIDKNQPDSVTNDVVFFYKNIEDYDLIRDIVEKMNTCLPEYGDEVHHNLNNITLFNSTIEVEPIHFNDDLDNVEYYYNEDTFKQIGKLIKKLKKNDKGLYILNGEKGTGKTNLIKHLACEVDKMFFYVPNYLIDSTINNPDFKNFIKKYNNPVLVLDDCESSLVDVFGKNNQTSFNVCQLIDGLQSDNNPVSIICIFNEFVEEDNLLLDSNNLVSVVDFNYLTEDESNELSKLTGGGKSFKNKTKMLDIIRKTNNSKYKKIGF